MSVVPTEPVASADPLERLLVAAILAVAAAVCLWGLSIAIHDRFLVPVDDLLGIEALAPTPPSAAILSADFWRFLLKRHVDHLIVPTRLLAYAEVAGLGWFPGRQTALTFGLVGSVIGLLAVLARAAHEDALRRSRGAGADRWAAPLAASCAGALLLWPGGSANLVRGLAGHLYQALFFTALATWWVARAAQDEGAGRRRFLVAGVAAGLVASVCTGTGLIAFFLLPLVGLAAGLGGSVWRRFSLSIVALLALVLVVRGAAVKWAADPTDVAGGLGARLTYPVVYLAAPIHTWCEDTGLAIPRGAVDAVVALCLLGTAAASVWILKNRRARGGLVAVGFALQWVAVASAFLTGLARFRGVVDQAQSTRYLPVAQAYWIGVLLVVLDALSRARAGRRRLGLVGVFAGLVALLAGSAPGQERAWRTSARVLDAAAAALGGVTEERDLLAFYRRPAVAKVHLARLEARGASFYSWPEARWIGRSLEDFARLEGDRCAGGSALEEAPGVAAEGRRFRGSVTVAANGSQPERVLLVQAGSIVGVAWVHRTLPRRLGFGGGEWPWSGATAASAAARSAEPVRAFAVFGSDDDRGERGDRMVCLLASRQPAP
jgi:hypothetical protein